MSIGTIYYLIPDLFYHKVKPFPLLKSVLKGKTSNYIDNIRHAKPRPIGGIKIHYQHCVALRKAGFDAKPLMLGRYEGNYFGYDIETVKIEEIGYKLKKNDVVVSTEFHPYDGLKFSGCKKIIFVQNWINIQKRLKQRDLLKNYLSMGYDEVLTCSNYTTNEVFKYMGIKAKTICNGIDASVFFEAQELRIPNRIMCLPRKNPKDLESIKSIILANNSEVIFHPVDGVDQITMATEFRKSDIFLATGYPEGFALPPLEAMHSGCAVVGFTGQAGSEFMVDGQTALTAPDGDCEKAAASLLRILEDVELKEKIRAGGKVKALEYTETKMAEEVVNYYKNLF